MNVLKIRNDNGEWTDILAIKGAPGEDGYTPVKGVDYFTSADKEELVNDVISALPSSEEVNY